MICHDCAAGNHEPCEQTMMYQDYASCDCQHRRGVRLSNADPKSGGVFQAVLDEANKELEAGEANDESNSEGPVHAERGESTANTGGDSAHAESHVENGAHVAAGSESSADRSED